MKHAEHEGRTRIRIRGGRITCTSCARRAREVVLRAPDRPLCRPCFDEPSEVGDLRQYVVPDDLCGLNRGCRDCRSA